VVAILLELEFAGLDCGLGMGWLLAWTPGPWQNPTWIGLLGLLDWLWDLAFLAGGRLVWTFGPFWFLALGLGLALVAWVFLFLALALLALLAFWLAFFFGLLAGLGGPWIGLVDLWPWLWWHLRLEWWPALWPVGFLAWPFGLAGSDVGEWSGPLTWHFWAGLAMAWPLDLDWLVFGWDWPGPGLGLWTVWFWWCWPGPWWMALGLGFLGTVAFGIGFLEWAGLPWPLDFGWPGNWIGLVDLLAGLVGPGPWIGIRPRRPWNGIWNVGMECWLGLAFLAWTFWPGFFGLWTGKWNGLAWPFLGLELDGGMLDLEFGIGLVWTFGWVDLWRLEVECGMDLSGIGLAWKLVGNGHGT